jgi:Family of unknown function (DUF6544)
LRQAFDTPAGRNSLPVLIEGYLARSIPPGADDVRQVEITQAGEMVRRPGGRALPFTATERFDVAHVAFSWNAQFRLAPLISLRVRDGYASGRGALEVRAIGIRLQHQSGPDIDLAEAYRYVAELPWVPYAMRHNPDLEWRTLDQRRVEVATLVGQSRVNLIMSFNPAGDVEGCLAHARPRDVGGRSVPTGWGGLFSNYASFDGLRMPTRGEVYWDLPGGRFVYWRGEITRARTLGQPFDRVRAEGRPRLGAFTPPSRTKSVAPQHP